MAQLNPRTIEPIADWSSDKSSNGVVSALTALSLGDMVVVVDPESKRTVLVVAAECATVDQIAYMIRRGGGIISVALLGSRLRDLDLPQMVRLASDETRPAYTISVDAKHSTSTGISAADRWATIRVLIDDDTIPDDLARPGHVYPQRYVPGGVLTRRGFTEAAMDLVVAAGLYPAAVFVDLMDDEGEHVTATGLRYLLSDRNLASCQLEEVVEYLSDEVGSSAPGRVGIGQNGLLLDSVNIASSDRREYRVLRTGVIATDNEVPVFVYVGCVMAELGSRTCGCRAELDDGLATLADEGPGLLIYLDGSAFGRTHHMRNSLTTDRSESGLRLLAAETLAEILQSLKVEKIRLIGRHAPSVETLQGCGFTVATGEPTPVSRIPRPRRMY